MEYIYFFIYVCIFILHLLQDNYWGIQETARRGKTAWKIFLGSVKQVPIKLHEACCVHCSCNSFVERERLFPLYSLLKNAQSSWSSLLPPYTHPSRFHISWFNLNIPSAEHPKPNDLLGQKSNLGSYGETSVGHRFPRKPSRTCIHPWLRAAKVFTTRLHQSVIAPFPRCLRVAHRQQVQRFCRWYEAHPFCGFQERGWL